VDSPVQASSDLVFLRGKVGDNRHCPLTVTLLLQNALTTAISTCEEENDGDSIRAILHPRGTGRARG
jgi:hypothetical protein